MASQKDVAAHLDLSDRSIRDLVSRNIIPGASHGNWDLDACRVAYIRHLRAVAAAHKSAGGDGQELDYIAEKARLAKAQADGQELKNAQTRGELLPAADVVLAIQNVFGRVRARLLSLPTKAASLVMSLRTPAEAKKELTALVHEALAELSSQEIIASAAPAADRAARGTGGGKGGQHRHPGVDATAGSDGEPVGGPKKNPKSRGQRRARKVADKQR